MSRLDDFEEILNSVKGRKLNPAMDLFKLLEIMSKGYEDHYRVGLLVGKKLTKNSFSIFDVVFPKQDSSPKRTFVQDWENGVREAKTKGEIVGTVFYSGKTKPDFLPGTLTMLERVCSEYDIPHFSISINYNGEFNVINKNEQAR